MTQEQIDNIRDTYHEAAEAVGLPEGIELTVNPSAGAFAYGRNVTLQVTAWFVTDGGTWAVAEHSGPVKRVHAERYLERALERHSTVVN